ncbi:MAG: hypothetical protein GW941_01865 [Candidatus Pacebacteria bacterium]|nr:hypothetical protein [Candidatus Paceibacterota bacterium]
MLKNPFRKKKSISDKVVETLHIPVKKGHIDEAFIKRLQSTFLYISLFLAGYIIAKLQVLIN